MKLDVKDAECELVDWIHVIQDGSSGRFLWTRW